jgi:hypothetical protein
MTLLKSGWPVIGVGDGVGVGVGVMTGVGDGFGVATGVGEGVGVGVAVGFGVGDGVAVGFGVGDGVGVTPEAGRTTRFCKVAERFAGLAVNPIVTDWPAGIVEFQDFGVTL